MMSTVPTIIGRAALWLAFFLLTIGLAPLLTYYGDSLRALLPF